MKPGDQVVRLKHTWNLMQVGDVRTVKSVKPYNKSLVANLEGDHKDIFHACRNLGLWKDYEPQNEPY